MLHPFINMPDEPQITPAMRSEGEAGSGSSDRTAHASSKEPTAQAEATKSKLPDWLIRAWKVPRTWKNFARCMIATLATMVLMLAQSCEWRGD